MATREQVPALTGLRGVGILLVVHAHYANWCSPFTLAGLSPYYLSALAASSSFGMTLFFTLSGWVIVYHHADFGWREQPAAAFARFLFLRLSRLYPILLLFLALNFKRVTVDTDFYGEHWLSAALVHLFSVQSWYPVGFKGELADGDGYSLSWSISTEIGMYLMFAAGLAVAGWLRLSRRTLAIGALVYVLAIVAVVLGGHEAAQWLSLLPAVYDPVGPGRAWAWFYNISPYFRFAQFIMGGAAAVMILRGWDERLRRLLSLLAPLALLALLWLYWRGVLGATTRSWRSAHCCRRCALPQFSRMPAPSIARSPAARCCSSAPSPIPSICFTATRRRGRARPRSSR